MVGIHIRPTKMLSLLKNAGLILIGSWFGAAVLSPLIVIYHYYSGAYSYLLDGVVQDDLIWTVGGYTFFLLLGSIILAFPIFFLIFLIFWFVDRQKTVIHPLVLRLCAALFSFLIFCYAALNQGDNLFLRLFIIFGTPIILNFLVFNADEIWKRLSYGK